MRHKNKQFYCILTWPFSSNISSLAGFAFCLNLIFHKTLLFIPPVCVSLLLSSALVSTVLPFLSPPLPFSQSVISVVPLPCSARFPVPLASFILVFILSSFSAQPPATRLPPDFAFPFSLHQRIPLISSVPGSWSRSLLLLSLPAAHHKVGLSS